MRLFDRRRILTAIETQLGHVPTHESRNRKQLRGLVPPFEAVPPIWELRVGGYRIFYDVDEEERRVYVRAVRRKPPHTNGGDPMKTIAVRDLQKRIRRSVELSQKEGVVVTRHGRPAAVLIGVEGQDWEDIVFQTSADFWKMIERRRHQKTISLAEVRRRLTGRYRRRR